LALKTIRADANQVEMALLNLAVNARDAMPQGGGIILAARDEIVPAGGDDGLKPGRYVCLSVSDTGIGMDAETLNRATEPFFTTKGPGKGTGLGLPMVHGLAEQSGGRFNLKSRRGEGTTAELWLPVAEVAVPALEQSPPPSARRVEKPQNPLVVLAVDDDRLVLTNTVAMLDDLGHTGIGASSGRKALEILRQVSVDMVITDQVMPQMTGLQLAEVIKAEWPDLPVILTTGFAEIPPGAMTLPRLPKPFTQAELAKGLEKSEPLPRKIGRILRFGGSSGAS
jgi:CheY-like chemotaxis protein